MSELFNNNNNIACGEARLTKRACNFVNVDLGPTNQRLHSEASDLKWADQGPQSQFSSGYPQSMDMYNEHGQYSSQGYQNSYGAYQNYSTPSDYNLYQGYNQTQSGYSSSGVQPIPPGDEYPHRGWEPVNDYHNMSQPPPSALNRQNSTQGQSQQHQDLKKDNKKEAIAQEIKQQKAQMAKQREDYVRKILVLRRELDLLRAQKQELLAEHSPEHDNNYILKENNKLQNEIQCKMKTINNVIEMLTNIIGDEKTLSELEAQTFNDESPRHHSRRSMSVTKDQSDSENRYNYVHYDPELHWCRICDVFPKSAKDLLMHLHSKEHKEVTQERDMVDTPWHKLPPEAEMPYYEGAPKKRLPIKGLQFFISATAWYCKLCDIWMGDLHCASQHLKSYNHNQNYTSFVEQNPHWEIEWLKDRERALSRIASNKNKPSESDEDPVSRHKRKRHEKGSPSLGSHGSKKKRKKMRKKRKYSRSSDTTSSSSSTDSSSDEGSDNDKSKSIRVAMRNKMKLQAQMIMNEDLGGKWEVLGRLVEERKKNSMEMGKESEPEDTLISQWMTIKETEEKDKKLLDNLKDRMKQKQEAEKARLAQLEQKKREKEKEEQELKEQKEREEREQREREEAKRRELEELRSRERDRIKFKTKDKYRRRYSPSHDSPDSNSSRESKGNRGRHSRSPSSERRRYRDRSSDRYHHKEHKHENGHKSTPDSKRRSKTPNNRHRSKHRSPSPSDSSSKKMKKPPQPPSFKKLPFIGRMPLFKNKKLEEKPEKEIKKEDYEPPRQTRFQPGNLARAFLPEPDVVCFPKLSTIPPIMEPPPPPPSLQTPQAPSPPKISETEPPKKEEKKSSTSGEEQQQQKQQKNQQVENDHRNEESKPEPKQGENLPQDFQDALNYIYPDSQHSEMQYHYGGMEYEMMYGPHMYDYNDMPLEMGPPPPPLPQDMELPAPPQGMGQHIPMEHTMPLQPPPLPPDDPNDDLALLGISADDMAAQMF